MVLIVTHLFHSTFKRRHLLNGSRHPIGDTQATVGTNSKKEEAQKTRCAHKLKQTIRFPKHLDGGLSTRTLVYSKIIIPAFLKVTHLFHTTFHQKKKGPK